MKIKIEVGEKTGDFPIQEFETEAQPGWVFEGAEPVKAAFAVAAPLFGAVSPLEINLPPTTLGTNATAIFTDNFTPTLDPGEDGQLSIDDELALDGTDVGSGLFARGPAGAKGTEIVLNRSGNVITGSADGTNYFNLAVDPARRSWSYEISLALASELGLKLSPQ